MEEELFNVLLHVAPEAPIVALLVWRLIVVDRLVRECIERDDDDDGR